MSSSTVTYTSVYTDSEPWRFQWVFEDELEAPDAVLQSLRQAPSSPDYVPGPKEPEQAPISPDYVPELEYPKYLRRITEEDPEEDPADYPADGRDDDDESSDVDDDDDDDDDEEQEASKDDDEEEEEHPALADSSAVPVDDLVPSAEDTEIPSPPLPLPSPPTTSPTYAEVPLGYRATRIWLRAAHPPSIRDTITTPDVWDDMVGDMEEKAPITIEGLSQRVIDLSTTLAWDTHEISS
ncbi:hypothetical protein Tco_1044039 [Tanacetum coccineum]|uniref:Uncharacterized protein n=1 Tax=Tanacetum coccineum TaxID=301880 RepID=A0ABQ5GQ12_9ASTR